MSDLFGNHIVVFPRGGSNKESAKYERMAYIPLNAGWCGKCGNIGLGEK